MNVRNTQECISKQKPVWSVKDERFERLIGTFLPYFSNWLRDYHGRLVKNINNNPFINRFDKVSEKNYQVKYVLTERFCQGSLENYFGKKRSKGRRKDNPNLRTFGYEDNALHNSKISRPIFSNSRKDEEQNIEVKNAEPLLSRTKKKIPELL